MIGYVPFGLEIKPGEVSYENNRLTTGQLFHKRDGKRFLIVDMHIGNEIVEIYSSATK